MSELEYGYKINRYFYMDANQKILKYKRYCIISDCEKISSFNYINEKNPLYCFKHKLKNIFIWKMFIRINFTISIIHKTTKSKP